MNAILNLREKKMCVYAWNGYTVFGSMKGWIEG